MLDSPGKAIAQNAAWLLVATTGQKVIAFFAFTMAAGIVGRFVTGEYFYAVAVTSLFVVLGDLGMTPVVIRAIASGAEGSHRLFGAVLRAKIFLVPMAALCAVGFVLISGASSVIVLTTVIAAFVMSADSVHLALYGALRGRQLLRYEALGMFIGQALTAIAAISAATSGWGAPGLAMALLVGSTWNVGWAWAQTRRNRVAPERPQRADFRMLARQALPFALAGIFVKVYSYLDSLMLKAFHGEADVGTYAVAYKVTYAFQFLPLVFTAALFPAMSAVHADGDKEKLQRVFAGALRLMAIVGAPLTAGIAAVASRFIPTVYGLDFLGSVAVLEVLPWVLLPIFLDFPIGSLLNATHRAHLKTGAMGATMVLNAVLNAFLIPLYGPVGAAWAGVGSFWFLLFVGVFFTWKELPSLRWFGWLLARSGMVAGAIWVAVREPGAIMPFPLAVLFGAAVGVIALLVTRLLTLQDVTIAWQWLMRRVKGPDPIDEEAHA
ncbi:MAG: hypothetical protein RL141_25 [Candidatus Parcubacteria bacterium]|jgi:O-antigen/teichoic acid export membrane protein